MEINSDKKDHPAPVQETTEPKVEVDMKEVLLSRRNDLAGKLKGIDVDISHVHEEYSKKLEQLQIQKRPLEEALHHIEALLQLEGYLSTSSQNADKGSDTVSVARTAPVVDAAFALLQELHSPMHYKAIATKLQERNIYIPGKNPAATLLSKMSRDSRFKRGRKRGTYALSTWRARATKPKSPKSRTTGKN